MDVPATGAELAAGLGVCRATLYYRPKLPEKDCLLKALIEGVWEEFPEYGGRRLAIALKVNRKRLKRVMNRFGMKPPRRRVRLTKPEDLDLPVAPYPNILGTLCPITINVVWVADFTYVLFQGRFYYLATVIDLFSREVIGWNILSSRTVELVKGAFEDALRRTGAVPFLFHTDQGSQYTAGEYLFLLRQRGVLVSMSKKASPWQNPHQESYYSNFKLELGEVSRFETLGELIAEIHFLVHRYNARRIHTALKMAPAVFRERHLLKGGFQRRVQSV
jgi:transposase InsO family protein